MKGYIMQRLLLIMTLVSLVFTGCGKKEEAAAPAEAPAPAPDEKVIYHHALPDTVDSDAGAPSAPDTRKR